MAAPTLITQAGEPVTHFDLDAVEAEAERTPFTFTLKGEMFTMLAPEDVDWRALADTEAPDWLYNYVGALLGDDFERFQQHAVPQWKLNKLLEACQEHYGVTPGGSKASARSSRSTRRR